MDLQHFEDVLYMRADHVEADKTFFRNGPKKSIFLML